MQVRDDGSAVLAVRVRAVPDKGKANTAVLALLAEALDLPRSTLVLATGETARLKTVTVTGDAQILAAKLAALVLVR